MTRLHEDLLREFQGFAQTAPAAKSLTGPLSLTGSTMAQAADQGAVR
jgi:hypothetical protein